MIPAWQALHSTTAPVRHPRSCQPGARTFALALAAQLACGTLGLLAQSPDSSAAAACTADPLESLAQKYAPVYHFAPGERYFPTIPFFTAFDSRNNSELGVDSATDFEDQEEVYPARGEGQAWGPWRALDSAYQGLIRSGEAHRRGVVFYRVQAFGQDTVRLPWPIRIVEGTRTEGEVLWEILRSDDQLWKRNGLATTHARLRAPLQFWSIEYYSYYVKDTGLQGHPLDIEKVFVFVPQDPADAREFRVVVGEGHSRTTPNNVLVLAGPQSPVLERPHILVELGGHSSAPDLPPFGDFAPGYDANFHIDFLWGTRDVQSIAGRGYWGGYKPWLTIPRDTTVAVRLSPTDVLIDPTDSLSSHYGLLPVSLLQCTYSAAARGDTAEARNRVQYIGAQLRAAWGIPSASSDTLRATDSALARLSYWNRPLTKKAVQIWEHERYTQSPVEIFKRHLYFDRSKEALRVGIAVDAIQGVRARAGLAFGLAPILKIPGLFEFELSSAGKWRLPTPGLTYSRDYYRFLTWYIGASLDCYTACTKRELAEYSLNGGIILLPRALIHDRSNTLTLTLSYFDARVGARAPVDGISLQPATMEFQLRFRPERH